MASTKDSASRIRRARRHSPDEARRLIMDGAVRFLATRPYRDLTVRDLMDLTPLSRPAFYRYFQDLPRLIEVLLAELEADLRAVPNPWIQGRGEPVAALRESLGGLVRATADHGPVLRAIAEAAPLDEKLMAAWEAFLGRWDQGVEVRLKAQLLTGQVTGIAAGKLAFALNRLVVSVLIAEFGGRSPGDPGAVAAALHRVWAGAIYGEVQAPGMKLADRTGR